MAKKARVPLPATPPPAPDFTIVGVAASAGGFEAFTAPRAAPRDSEPRDYFRAAPRAASSEITRLLRIRPYKTPDNRIDGAVIALFDLDPAKK